MFTATITGKTTTPTGALQVTVRFSDGASTFEGKVVPQDANGLRYFIEGRLRELNLAGDNAVAVGPYVPPTEPAPTVDAPKVAWLTKVSRLQWIKMNLIDTGVFTGSEKAVTDLRAAIQADFLPRFLA